MIRAAVAADAARMAEINVFGWRCAYRGIIPDAFLFSKLLVHKRMQAFEKGFEARTGESYVYEADGIVKAFMSIGECRDGDKKDAFELWGVYVEPCLRGQGIGRKLMEFCEERARSGGYPEIVLWVFKENRASIGFYEKLGYTFDGKEEIMDSFNAVKVRFSKRLKRSDCEVE